MKTLVDALAWRDGARAWTLDPRGQVVTVEFRSGKKFAFWTIWMGHDRPQDITQVRQELARMEFWPQQAAVVDGLRTMLWSVYRVSLDDAIWQEAGA